LAARRQGEQQLHEGAALVASVTGCRLLVPNNSRF
jgi:hypothetical protein